MNIATRHDRRRPLGEQSVNASPRGVRAVALFEAAKGAVVIVAGCGLLALVHRDLQTSAERLVRLAHLNPARHYPRVFLDAAAHVDDRRLLMLAGAAFLYAGLRFIEAYGLWRARVWAEWLAIISGAIYVPLEVYELAERPTLLRFVVLLVNLLIVCYLLNRRRAQRRASRHRMPDARDESCAAR